MSDGDSESGSSTDPTPESAPPDGYTVGYRNPPKEFRFKPGNNANPRGRPKGSRKENVIVKELFLERLPVRDGDGKKSMSKLEIILTKLLNRAIKDDHKAQVEAIKIAQKDGLLTPEQEEKVEKTLSETDKAILLQYLNRQTKKSKNE